jgi:hypothetical protein
MKQFLIAIGVMFTITGAPVCAAESAASAPEKIQVAQTLSLTVGQPRAHSERARVVMGHDRGLHRGWMRGEHRGWRRNRVVVHKSVVRGEGGVVKRTVIRRFD